jgi:protein-L-isoaspartate(D-aspartate) O-methyltransferase
VTLDLIDRLVQKKWLRTPIIIDAFRKIKRKDFLRDNLKDLYDANEALPIGYGQTISQSLVVAFMLEKLQPKQREKILDIGSGSGYTTALLAQIVGNKGKIISIELIPELKRFGEKNLLKYNFVKKGIVKFICADGSKGYKKEAPFDKILVSASVKKEIPKAWKDQLKIGGKIVSSVRESIWVLEKQTNNQFKKNEYPGFIFVPLVQKQNIK